MIKFFLGSVPFGCDNIGDEAILESTIKIIRRNFPNSEICVSTAKPKETAKLFSCKAVGLVGFGKLDKNPKETIKAIKNSHVYIWAGATGLSDYPEAGLVGLEVAQKAGLKTIIWNVGMDSQFNPVHFKIGGKKAKLCKIASTATANVVNAKKLAEGYLIHKIGKKISSALSNCDLVFMRDTQSLKRLRKFASLPNAAAIADSATILTSHNDSFLDCLSSENKKALCSSGAKIGICVSSQRPINDIESFSATLDNLIENNNAKIFFIPMNPKTDLAFMGKIRQQMRNKDKSFLLDGVSDWRNITAIASKCDVIVSSRLHLLILSANVGTAIVGISRGSKITNFMAKFGLPVAGSVYKCNFDLLTSQVEYALNNPEEFAKHRAEVYALFQERMEYAEKALLETISKHALNSSKKNNLSTAMNDDDLNLTQDKDNLSSVLYTREVEGRFLNLFQFDIRAMLLYVITKWKILLGVFVVTLLLSAQIFYYLSYHSSRAWAASVRIYHQTRSDKIPTFYMPMRTETVAHIFTSNVVSNKVAAELKTSVKGFEPEMLSNVVVSIEKAKSDIITITAYASAPKIAAAIANRVADFGIAEYLSRQNASINAMLNDRLAKKKERLAEIAIIKEKMCELISPESQRFPSEEIIFRREELTKVATELNASKLKLSDIDIKIAELEQMLKETPKEIEFETTLDHTTQISLEGKRATLKQLRKRYTDSNPKIKMLLEEIKDLQEQQEQEAKEKSMPSKVTYRKNQTYADLELQLANAKLEKKSLQKMVIVHAEDVKRLQNLINKIHHKFHRYEELLSQENVLKKQVERIDISLQNIEVLMTTSVPDLSIFTHADVPSTSTMKNRQLKSLIVAIMVSLLYLIGTVIFKVLKFRFLASKEFLSLGLKDFGEIPLIGTVEKYVRDSAITRTYSLLIKRRENKRIALFVKYNESQCCNSIINDIITLNDFNKYKTFRIDCVFKNDMGETPKYYKSIITENEDSTRGIFEYHNLLHVHEERFHALVDDIKTLSEKYESVILTVLCQDNYFVISQFAKLVNLIVFMPSFDSTKKINVIAPENMAKNLLPEDKEFGGILIQVPKYYYERR